MNSLRNLKKDVEKTMKNDPAHDFDHILRVYKNAQQLCKKEKINPLSGCLPILIQIPFFFAILFREVQAADDSHKTHKLLTIFQALPLR